MEWLALLDYGFSIPEIIALSGKFGSVAQVTRMFEIGA